MKMPLLSKMFAEIIATIAASAILPARASTFTVGGSGNTFTISRSGAGVADPQDEKSTFRIASFPMKADGTPDFANVAFYPPKAQWNIPDAPVTWKCAATLEGPWMTVTEAGGGSPETPRPPMQFFKAVLFGDTDAD